MLSLLTAITVLWHAVVGCCAHHDHREHAITVVAEHRSAIKPSAREHACCCKHSKGGTADENEATGHRGHEQAAAEEHSPADHAPFAPCDGEQCSFAFTRIVTANDLSLIAAWNDSVAPLDLVLPATTSIFRDLTAAVDDRPSTLRAHLALRVLLI